MRNPKPLTTLDSCFHRNDKATTPNAVRRTKYEQIGFVWLCFLRLRHSVYCHNLLSNKTLRQFVPIQIGFVFSNNLLTPSTGLGANIDWLCLALNWLCFFAAQNHKNLHNILSYIHLSSFCPFENWVCFFKLSSIFRRFLLFFTCFLHYFGFFRHVSVRLRSGQVYTDLPCEITSLPISRGEHCCMSLFTFTFYLFTYLCILHKSVTYYTNLNG